MIVVSDTTPLDYLLLSGLDHILPALFGTLLIPAAVHQELASPLAPQSVRVWITEPPAWLEIRRAPMPLPQLAGLDPGEREAITLALSLKADLVLLDEAKGRRVAVRHGLSVCGTLGVLDRAGSRGMLDLDDALARLRRTSFRASPKLLESLREQH